MAASRLHPGRMHRTRAPPRAPAVDRHRAPDPGRSRRRGRSPPGTSRPAGRASTPTRRWSPTSQPSPPPTRASSTASRSARATRAASCGRPRSPTTSATDEAEPEVLFDGLHHADEHMGLEMTLHILHWLVDGYGSSAADHDDRQHARDLDRLRGQPRRRRVRHHGRPVPLLAQEPPADARLERDRHRPQPELRLPLGRRRADEHEPAGDHLPRARGRSRRRRRAPCATSWPAASSAAGSRSGPRSRSTRPAGS